MIDIRIMPECITARGHAADAAGCAAVSAILYALAGGLENLGGRTRWQISSGCAEIRLPPCPEARAMHLMAEVGLRQLAAARADIRIASAAEESADGQTHGNESAGGKNL